MKKISFIFIILVFFFTTCKNDIEAPIIDIKDINVVSKTNNVSLMWTAANDLITDQKSLLYKVVVIDSKTDEIGVLEKQGLVLMDWKTNTSSFSTKKEKVINKWVYILVKDQAGNIAVYSPVKISENQNPIPGNMGLISFSNLKANELTISWFVASNRNNGKNLEYKIIKSENPIKDLDTAKALSEDAIVKDWSSSTIVEFIQNEGVLSYVITGLASNNKYNFNIIVRDEDGEALYENSEITTSDFLTNKNFNLLATNISGKSLTLTWDLAKGINDADFVYKVVISEDASVKTIEQVENAKVGVLADWGGQDKILFEKERASIDVWNLTFSKNYYFNVLVKDNLGNKKLYKQLKAKTSDSENILPNPGNDGKITYSEIGFKSVKLSWTLATDFDSDDASLEYKILHDSSEITDLEIAQALPGSASLTDWMRAGSGGFALVGNTISYTLTGLNVETTYNFNILVRDEDDGQALYQNIELTTLNQLLIEDADLSVTELEYDSFVLNWKKAISGLELDIYYKVVISSSSDINSIEQVDDLEDEEEGVLVSWDEQDKIVFSEDEASFLVSGLNYETVYYLNIMARDEANKKEIYNQIEVTTTAVVDNIAPVPGENGIIIASKQEKTLIEISWSEASDDYTWIEDLEYKAVYSSSPVLTIAAAESATTIQDWSRDVFKANASSLYVGETYYFNVLVRDRAGNIALYNHLEISTPEQFEFYQWDVDTFTIGSGYTESLGPKLAFKDDAKTTMVITYMTAKVNDDAILRFGDDPNNLKYEFPSLKQAEVHHLEISNLDPDTEYYYSLSINTESFVTSTRDKYEANTVLSFKTMSDSELGQSVLLIGDQQPKNDGTQQMNNVVARALRERIDEDDVRMVVQVGDVCEMGVGLVSTLGGVWERTLKSLTMFASKVPQMSVIGNHDRQSPYQYKTVFPYNYAPGVTINDDDAYYSLDFGKAHFVFLDSKGSMIDYNGNIPNSQLAWFEQDVQDAIARGQEWIFVSFHLSMLCNGADPDMGMKKPDKRAYLQEGIIPIAAKYKIDAIFWGHDHLYEHWQYDYGQNGYFYQNDNERIFAESPLMFFEIGGGGAVSEWSWSGMRTNNQNETKTWYNTATEQIESVPASQNAWKTNRFFDAIDSYFGDTFSWITNWNETGYTEQKFYYHFPFEVDENNNVLYENGKKKYSSDLNISYSTDNEWYGYQYGETTPHYMEIKFNYDGSATLSTHYPNHKIVGDRPGMLPPEAKQEFIIYKKNR